MSESQEDETQQPTVVQGPETIDRYLEDTAVVDWQTPAVYAKARALSAQGASAEERIRAAFEFVRDAIGDALAEGHASEAVAFTASEVLREGAGLSYARCHLLAALLRAQGIPAGFGYQRLADPGCRNGFALHGFAAALLAEEERWLPLDPAGTGEDGARPSPSPRRILPESRIPRSASTTSRRSTPGPPGSWRIPSTRPNPCPGCAPTCPPISPEPGPPQLP